MNRNKSFGNISLSTKELNIKWTIEDASQTFKEINFGGYIMSPPVLDGELKWYVYLYPSGRTGNNKYVEIYLCLFKEDNKNGTQYSVNFIVDILNENNEKIMENAQVNEVFNPKKCKLPSKLQGYSDSVGFKKFFLISKLENYLTVNKSLIINTKICKKTDNFEIEQLRDNTDNYLKKEFYNCNNFRSILNDEVFSDLELMVGSKSYLAHKAILAAKSTILMNILESNKNNKRQVIEINDLSDNAVEEMLRFIYTNEVENINQVAQDLLEAADKYNIRELKKLCEDELIKEITIENVIDTLILAELHSAENLKTKAIDLIGKNINQFNNSDNWLKLNPSLMTEIISAAIPK